MNKNNKILWENKYWDKSWNMIAGCTGVTPGCDNCWAEVMKKRMHGKNQLIAGYENGPCMLNNYADIITRPYHWKKPRIIALNWLSDLYHEKFPASIRKLIFHVMSSTPRHKYLLLTKRPHLMAKEWKYSQIPDNVYVGTSISRQQDVKMIKHLLKIDAKYHWVSAEPLLSEINIPIELLSNLDQVIIGGESGPKARPCHPDNFNKIIQDCTDANTLWFFKSWGNYIPSSYEGSRKTMVYVKRNGEFKKELKRINPNWVPMVKRKKDIPPRLGFQHNTINKIIWMPS